MKRIQQCFCVCLLLVLMLAALPARADLAYGDQFVITNCDSSVSLRVAPSASAGRMTKVPKFAVVLDEHIRKNGFRQVSYAGLTGYIKEDYLTPCSLALKVAKSGVKLRKSGKVGAGSLRTLKKGEVVIFTGAVQNGYYQVCAKGKYGYVHPDDLRAAVLSDGLLKRVVNCKDSIPMRGYPEPGYFEYDKVSRVPLWAEVTSFGSVGHGIEFVYYNAANTFGFVQSKYITENWAFAVGNASK